MARKSFNAKERDRLYKLYAGKCYLCDGQIDRKTERFEIEHVIPFAISCDNGDDNLRALSAEPAQPDNSSDMLNMVDNLIKSADNIALHFGDSETGFIIPNHEASNDICISLEAYNDAKTKLANSIGVSAEPAQDTSNLFGPYGYINGHRALSEDSWAIESDPLSNDEEYFSIPLYAKVDPFKIMGTDIKIPPAQGEQWRDIATAPKDVLVVVYTPPRPHDHPDAFHVDFDYIDTGIADDYWYNHGEAHEHFSCVGKPEGSIGGIPEKAPYTHWMPLPAAPTSEEGR